MSEVERHRRLMALFDEVCDLPAEERQARVAAVRAEDVSLARDLDALLRADSAPTPLDDVTVGDLLVPAKRDRPERIGDYRILGLLGEGGMGVVYEAEQELPRRRVALKVIRALACGQAARKRFEYEAHALARLNHPGISKIYEAGSDGEQLFFAMELVAGDNLMKHAERRRLTDRERLELWARVCDAVHHAHVKGVVHCDLKPPNILVDEAGQPKVLDFGIARIVDPDAEVTAGTVTGVFLGTPAYMSPEQTRARADELDARCDVYSLGVVGFELLAGRLPRDVKGKPLPEVIRIVAEEETLRLGVVRPELRGDVETIVGKTLEREPERRYQSAAAIADDVRRFLRDEAIEARPATAGYQLRKFARRNRGLVAAVGAVIALLVAGVVVSPRLYVKAERARVALARENDALIIAEAQAELAADPTRAVARLVSLRREAAEWASAGAIAGQAESRGVAREVLRGHADDVRWAELAGDTLLTAGRDQTVRVWDLGARTVRVVEGFGDEVSFVRGGGGGFVAGGPGGLYRGGERVATGGLTTGAWSPDGVYFAASGDDGRVRVWRAALGEPVATLTGHEGVVTSVAWAADSRALASAGEDGKVFRWEVAGWTGRPVSTHTGEATEVAFTPQGVVSVGRDGRLVVDGVQLAAGGGELKQVVVSPVGDLVWAGREGVVHVLRAGETQERVVHAHDGVVRALAMGNGVFASAGDDRVVLLWDLRTLERRALLGHEGRVHHVGFAAGGKLLLSASNDGSARVWPVAAVTAAAARTVAFGAGGWVAWAGADGVVHARDLREGGYALELTGHTDEVYQVAFASDVSVITAGRDKTVRLWDLRGGRGQSFSVAARAVAVVVDGGRAAVALASGEIVMIDLASGKRSSLVGHTTRVNGLVFGGAGEVVSASDDRTVRLWDAGAGRVVVTCDDAAHEVARGGAALVVACGDGTVRVWSPEQGERVLRGHTASVDRVAIAGDWVASGGADRTVRLWNLATGETRVLVGHTGAVTALAFVGRGQLASGGADQTARVWDLATGEGRVVVRGRGPVSALAVAGAQLAVVGDPDGLRLVQVARADGQAEVAPRLGQLTRAVIGEGGSLESVFRVLR